MSPPDYRNDLGAFIKAVYGDEFKLAAHHESILNSMYDQAKQRGKDYRNEEVKFTGFAMDPGKPGGDHTAYVRYSYRADSIVIEDITTEEVFGHQTAETSRDTEYMWRGRRQSITDLVARIGQKRCTCDGGLVHVGDFETGRAYEQVCTRCDGFNAKRRRPIRPR